MLDRVASAPRNGEPAQSGTAGNGSESGDDTLISDAQTQEEPGSPDPDSEE